MKSPKLPFALSEIEECINVGTIKHLWKKKLGYQLRKQILIDVIEYKDIDYTIDTLSNSICNEIKSGTYLPCRPLFYLVEKSRGLCRQMTLSQPRDLLLLQCLSSALHGDIKRSQPSAKAYFEPGQKSMFSKRHTIAEDDYGSVASWKRFQTAILDFSKERRFLVITDVANFYDFINFRHLRNIVSSVCDVRESVLDFLIFILSNISWSPDFMPRSEIGLPQMEIEAPRVLANSMLFELDRVAEKYSFGDYARFMDDIDIGVDSISDAKRVIRDIDLTLQARQLRLNSSKTRILDSHKGDIVDHFCVRENKILDYIGKVAEIIETSRQSKGTRPANKALYKLYSTWKKGSNGENFGDSCRFFRGNGEKIFKRITAISASTGYLIPSSDLLELIKLRPSLRQYCFSALARHPYPDESAMIAINYFCQGYFVDDASVVFLSNFLLHANFTGSAKFNDYLSEFVRICVESESYIRVHSGLLVSTKFFSTADLYNVVQGTRTKWDTNYWLGRAVGGAIPRMWMSKEFGPKFKKIIADTANNDARHVAEFHTNIMKFENSAERITKYCSSINHSYPYGIYFPKALICLSLSQSPLHSHTISSILNKHKILFDDVYYSSWFNRFNAQTREDSSNNVEDEIAE